MGASRICPVILLISLIACSGPMAPGRKMQADYTPIYASASNEAGDSFGYNSLFHIVKHDREQDKVYTHVIPFYYHSEDGEGGYFTLIPPLYYGRKSAFEEDSFLMLFGTKKRGARRDVYPMFPLIRFTDYEQDPRRGGSFFFPFYDYSRDGDRHQLKILDLFGLFHLMDASWGIPGKEEEETGGAYSFLNVLNLVRLTGGGDHGGYRDFQVLTLLSSEKLSLYQSHWSKDEEKGGRTVFFPFYWHLKDEESETFHLWPLYGWETKQEDARKDHVLFPLFSYERDPSKNQWAVDCPWPLIRVMRADGEERENRFLPFYMDSRTEASRFLLLGPFYADYENQEGYRRRFYSPLFSHYEEPAKEEWGLDVVYPLFSHQRSPDRYHDRLIPLYWTTFDEGKRFVECTPLFWHYRNREGYVFNLLFPLYAHFGYGESDDTYSFLPLLKLIADRPGYEEKGRTQLDILWPFIMYKNVAERTHLRLFPLFSHISDRDLTDWGFLADIFQFKVERSKKTFTFLWFIPISWGGE